MQRIRVRIRNNIDSGPFRSDGDVWDSFKTNITSTYETPQIHIRTAFKCSFWIQNRLYITYSVYWQIQNTECHTSIHPVGVVRSEYGS